MIYLILAIKILSSLSHFVSNCEVQRPNDTKPISFKHKSFFNFCFKNTEISRDLISRLIIQTECPSFYRTNYFQIYEVCFTFKFKYLVRLIWLPLFISSTQ